MCWSLRVYGTVLHNLLNRCFTHLINWLYDFCCCCYCCYCCCGGGGGSAVGGCDDGENESNWCSCCCCDGSELRAYESKELNAAECGELNGDGDGDGDDDDNGMRRQRRWGITDGRSRLAYSGQHDYVIVDEVDANYLEISQRKVETEAYYLIVDRAQAEDILSVGYGDGACLVRPYKQADISIKYIVSVHAQRQYFHLFIRKMIGRDLYGIGQEKPNERLFRTPCDIIDFYATNPLQCTNKQLTLSLYLRPIAI